MLRRINLTLLMFAFVLLGSAVSAVNCPGQRLLRRIQARVESRIQQVEQRLESESAEEADVVGRGEKASPTLAPNAPGSPAGPDTTRARPRLSPSAKRDLGNSILVPGDDVVRQRPQYRVSPARSERPSLGIEALPNREGIPGLTVMSVEAGSPADAAGLRQGDVIVAMNNTPTPTVDDVARQLQALSAGDRITATLWRGTGSTNVVIAFPASQHVAPSGLAGRPIPLTPLAPIDDHASELPAANAEAENPWSLADLGLIVRQSPDLRGVIVESVTSGSRAASAGIQAGDRIVSVESSVLADRRSLERELSRRSRGESFVLKLVRNGALIAADLRPVDTAPGTNSSDASSAVASGTTDENAAGSLLGGVGSVLGGFFGGNSASDAKERSLAAPEPQKLGAGQGPSKSEQAERINVVKELEKIQKIDVIDVGKNELIDQVTLETELKKEPLKLDTDPPSLEKIELELPPPPKKVDLNVEAERLDAIKQLRVEIEKLERRLKQLEEQQ